MKRAKSVVTFLTATSLLFGASTISFAQEIDSDMSNCKLQILKVDTMDEAKLIMKKLSQQPKTVYIEKTCIVNTDSNSIGTKTMSEDYEHADGLKVRKTASGEFDRDSSGKPYWTKGTSSEIKEISNEKYLRLGNVNSHSTEVSSSDKTCLKMSYNYDLEQYIVVAGKWFHVGMQECNGTTYFYIK